MGKLGSVEVQIPIYTHLSIHYTVLWQGSSNNAIVLPHLKLIKPMCNYLKINTYGII